MTKRPFVTYRFPDGDVQADPIQSAYDAGRRDALNEILPLVAKMEEQMQALREKMGGRPPEPGKPSVGWIQLQHAILLAKGKTDKEARAALFEVLGNKLNGFKRPPSDRTFQRWIEEALGPLSKAKRQKRQKVSS